MNHPFRRQGVAMDAALASQSAVPCGGREPAAFAPLHGLPWWCRGGCARPAAGGSREPIRDTQAEGKIKGSARMCPPSQSARGLGTAPCWVHLVPCRGRILPAAGARRVPFPIPCAQARWSGLHGRA